MSRIYIVFLLLLTSCVTTTVKISKASGYDLSKPNASWSLPESLREISGLIDINENTFACVQDENGILFIYDISKNEVVNQYKFNIDGDYEGITRIGETMYILRSDGTIFEVTNYRDSNFVTTKYETGIPAMNNEGLCYDPANNRLLIASKGKIAKGAEFKDKRAIYGFDLKTKQLLEEHVFDIDVETLKQFAIKHNIPLPTKARKKNGVMVDEPFIKFMTSAISIHPVSKKLYVLSAADHLFFIFSENGEIEHMEYLDPIIFNKAEGMTFLENNDMLITNEGQTGQATLLKFSYLK